MYCSKLYIRVRLRRKGVPHTPTPPHTFPQSLGPGALCHHTPRPRLRRGYGRSPWLRVGGPSGFWLRTVSLGTGSPFRYGRSSWPRLVSLAPSGSPRPLAFTLAVGGHPGNSRRRALGTLLLTHVPKLAVIKRKGCEAIEGLFHHIVCSANR